MPLKVLRKYGEAATIDFALFEADGIDFRVDAAHAAGDTVISKDEGAEASTTNGFTDEGKTYSIVLSATEMTCKRAMVTLVDQTGTKVWLDDYITIETYGHANAMHAFNLDYDFTGNNEIIKMQRLECVSSDGDAIIAKSTSAGSAGLYMEGTGVTGVAFRAIGVGSAGGGEYKGRFGLIINAGAGSSNALHIEAEGIGNAVYGLSTGGRCVYVNSAIEEGLYVQGGLNKAAVLFQAAGSGAGFECTGANGVKFTGSSIGGLLQGGATGVHFIGTTRGALIEGGITGIGAEVKGGTVSGNAVNLSTIDGHALNINAVGTDKHAIYALAAAGIGISAKGGGANPGTKSKGGVTGDGFLFEGGATSGNGYTAQALAGNGNGAEFIKHGTGLPIYPAVGGGIEFTDTVDGVTIENIYLYMLAMINGKFTKNFPNDGDIRFYKQDNSTPAFTVHVTDTDRTRI